MIGEIFSKFLCILWGFSSGIIISTGVVSFITIIGIIPRLAQKARIEEHYFAMGNSATLGIIFGTFCVFWNLSFPLYSWLIAIFSFAIGIFVGCLAAAVAEVLNVFPVFARRLKLSEGMLIFMLAFAIGKLVGGLYFWLYPGFIFAT